MATTKAGFTARQDSPLADELIGSDAENILARKYDIPEGEVITRGMLVGLVTADGTVREAKSANGDGSQTAFGIAAEDADSSDSPPADTQVNVYVRGSFNEHAVSIGTGLTLAGIRETLRDKGIYLETPVKRYPDA